MWALLSDSDTLSVWLPFGTLVFLSQGEVPNLYEQDEREQIINMLREDTRKAGWPEDRDSIWAFFVHRFRENLHIVLCMSPVGDAFRNRFVRLLPASSFLCRCFLAICD